MAIRRTLSVVVGACTVLTVVAACGGSAVSPEEAARANLAAQGGGLVPSAVGAPQAGTGPVAGSPATGVSAPGMVAGAAGGTGGNGGSGTATTGAGPSGSGVNAATGGVKAASCDGLKNQTGVSGSEVVLANISDLSGPVPGLFSSAQDGANAYVAYFNATNKLCGRTLKMLNMDSRTDPGADQTAYAKACEQAFAVVGSVSIQDAGGAGAAQGCGIPDLRSVSLSTQRANCSVCYAAQGNRTGYIGDGLYKGLRRTNKAATDSAAFLYLNTGGSPLVSKTYAEAARANGWKVKLTQGIDTTDFNYGPYVQRLKSEGIRFVNFVAATPQAVRLVQAMKAAGYKPELFQVTQTQYTKEYVDSAGSAADGTMITLPHVLFSSPNAEMKLYLDWLSQVKPGASPTAFGLFAWSAMRLFVEKSVGLGGKLTRAALLDAVRREHKWTANQLHLPMDVAGKNTYTCFYTALLNGGRWSLRSPKPTCGRLIRTSVAG